MKKRLIICCDGTWNDLEMRFITNVGRLVQALTAVGRSDEQAITQHVYYDDGVGADARSGLQKSLQGAVGAGIDNLIYEAYRHICINYHDGDEICLFGFSRGAYTARSVAGMIGKVGLVPRSELKHIPGALEAYRSKNPDLQQAFRKTARSVAPKITLLGCWDTVGALGIPNKLDWLPFDNLSRKRVQFHDLKLSPHIERALHAVAIDEQRKEFSATLMEKQKGSQKLVQAWFPGDHGCVGGGSWEKRGLANRCLTWMVEEASRLGVEIGVDWNNLDDRAMSDHSIYFPRETSFIYGKQHRQMAGVTVRWQDIHETARLRWAEDPGYRPPRLKSLFAHQLNSWSDTDSRKPPALESSLALGETAHTQVFSNQKENRTRIRVAPGEQYTLTISALQVWQDGDLDPCDIRGWNAQPDAPNPPYENGEPIRSGKLKSTAFKKAKQQCLVPEADWFELVLKTGDGDYQRVTPETREAETDPFVIAFSPKQAGELVFAANDLASRFDVIDKFDNNQGWVWLQVTRSG